MNELSGESFGTKWREPTGVQPINGGSVDACLPDAEFVMPGEGVPPPEDTRQPPEVIRPHFKSMVKRSVFVVVVADNSSQVCETSLPEVCQNTDGHCGCAELCQWRFGA